MWCLMGGVKGGWEWKVGELSGEEESGIGGVGVKWVDMWRKRSGEGECVGCK